MINITQRGDFNNVLEYLKKVKSSTYYNILDKYGKLGVDALTTATPADSGLTAVMVLSYRFITIILTTE